MLQLDMNVEIELKLRVPKGSMAKLVRHPLLQSAFRSARVSSVYFDTPFLDLKSKAVALRLRKVGGKWVQTVKGGGGVLAGVHTRCEWEYAVARGALDFTKIDDPHLVKLFGNPELRNSLVPVFSTEFSRKTVPVEFSGSVIECCLDRGKILAGDQEETISELELELKSGEPSALFEFALELQNTVPLQVEERSKAERGYALFLGTKGRKVTKAAFVEFEGKLDAGEACRQIVRGCLLQIQGNRQGLLDRDPDSEYLHQMRVGLRRMRSALSVFAFARPAFSDVLPELKWLGSELGPARNWDVFMEETFPPIFSAFPDHAGLEALRRAGDATREKCGARAQAAVSSQRFQKLILGLGLVLSRENWIQGETVGDFAKKTLEKRYRRFIRGGRGIASLDAAGLHALRISGKKLRYAAEFFSTLYPARASRSFLREMASLQDMLGAINDASTTSHLLEELPGNEAAWLVRGWVASEVGHRIAGLDKAWKKYKDIDPFWR